MSACSTCHRTVWVVPRPPFNDTAEAARYMLGGWAGTAFAAFAVLSGNPVAALAVSLPALGLFLLGAFA